MAFYRQIWLTFWSDPKVDDEFTPEDKYFYLYLLTNPQTNICGCYEVGMKQMARQTGYNEDTIKRLLERMKYVHEVIDFNLENKEIYVLNWYKYNWNNSGDVLNGVLKSAEKIKTEEFKEAIYETVESLKNGGFDFNVGKKNKRVIRGSIDPRKTSVTVLNSNNNNSIKEIIDYLNSKTNSRYTYRNKSYNKNINARLEEGFTVDDFKQVIDKKVDEWIDDEKMSKYLTPDTLFAPSKFEKYLNQKGASGGRGRNSEDKSGHTEEYAIRYSLD